MPQAGSITLESIIYDFTEESEQSAPHKYFKLYNLAYRAMDKLGIDYFYKIRTAKLPLTSSRSAMIPSDCISINKIGVFDDDGKCVIPVYVKGSRYPAFFYSSVVFFNFWNGFGYSNIDGYVGRILPDYNINPVIENGYVNFPENFTFQNVAMEYVSAPKEDGGQYLVPIHFREAIVAYLAWADIRSMAPSRKGGIGDKAQRRKDWFNERRLAIASYKPVRLF